MSRIGYGADPTYGPGQPFETRVRDIAERVLYERARASRISQDIADRSVTRVKLVGVDKVTSIPGAGADGDEVDFLADATTGIYWRLRHTGNRAYPWMAISNTPLVAEDDDQGTTTSTTYTDLTGSSVGPTLTLPVSGIYDVSGECMVANDTANQANCMSFAVGVTAAVDADMAFAGTTTNLVTVKAIDTAWRKEIPAGSLTLTAKYRVTGSNGYFEFRRLSARPILLGSV